jgi:hypothetical protein
MFSVCRPDVELLALTEALAKHLAIMVRVFLVCLCLLVMLGWLRELSSLCFLIHPVCYTVQSQRAIRVPSSDPAQPKAIRFRRLKQFMNGEDLKPADADGAVNTMALVAALLLTVPFSIIGSLTSDFWDAYEALVNACPNALLSAHTRHAQVEGALCGVMYTSMACIMVAAGYSVLRPTDEPEFRAWWKRGRFVMLFMFLSVVTAVVCAFTVFNSLVPTSILVGFTQDVCSGNSYNSAMGAMSALLIIVGICYAVML